MEIQKKEGGKVGPGGKEGWMDEREAGEKQDCCSLLFLQEKKKEASSLLFLSAAATMEFEN